MLSVSADLVRGYPPAAHPSHAEVAFLHAPVAALDSATRHK